MPPTPDEVDPLNKLFIELNNFIQFSSWDAFESMPQWRLKEFLVIIRSKNELGESTSAVERGVLAAVNRVCEELNSDF